MITRHIIRKGRIQYMIYLKISAFSSANEYSKIIELMEKHDKDKNSKLAYQVIKVFFKRK